LNWRDEIRELQMVPREEFEGNMHVRLDDLPKHVRGWFSHWLDNQGKDWLEDVETGGRIATAFDYDEWLAQMESRFRNADKNAQDADRDE